MRAFLYAPTPSLTFLLLCLNHIVLTPQGIRSRPAVASPSPNSRRASSDSMDSMDRSLALLMESRSFIRGGGAAAPQVPSTVGRPLGEAMEQSEASVSGKVTTHIDIGNILGRQAASQRRRQGSPFPPSEAAFAGEASTTMPDVHRPTRTPGGTMWMEQMRLGRQQRSAALRIPIPLGEGTPHEAGERQHILSASSPRNGVPLGEGLEGSEGIPAARRSPRVVPGSSSAAVPAVSNERSAVGPRGAPTLNERPSKGVPAALDSGATAAAAGDRGGDANGEVMQWGRQKIRRASVLSSADSFTGRDGDRRDSFTGREGRRDSFTGRDGRRNSVRRSSVELGGGGVASSHDLMVMQVC